MSLYSVKQWVKDNWVMPLSVLLSVSIQLSFISKSSIWHDEGYSLWLIKYDYWDILVRTARDVHPPLYYLALKLWTEIFGRSEMAARSLSTLCVAGIIILSYFLVKKLFGLGAARVAVIFLALAPFIIRYGQEARMYSLTALLLTAATLVLVYALRSKSWRLLLLYSIFMALAFYTHYYAVFMVPVHWIYVASRTHWRKEERDKKEFGLFNPWWWFANFLIVAFFLPWLPSAIGQFTRVQGGFWIPPVTIETLPATTAQMLQYTSLNSYHLALRIGILALVIALSLASIILNKKNRSSVILLSAWAAMAPLAVFMISLLARPVYIDRYFVYTAVAFYILLAVLLYLRPLNYLYRIRPIIVSAIALLFCYGISNVYAQSNHQMSKVGNFMNNQYRSGDFIVSGELYTYLDFSYYNATGQPVYLYAPGGVNGYGETSLIYDQPDLIVSSFDNISNNRIWIIGKAGEKDYFRKVPTSWKLQKTFNAKDSEIRLYVNS